MASLTPLVTTQTRCRNDPSYSQKTGIMALVALLPLNELFKVTTRRQTASIPKSWTP
jgi:hypothetical protein